MNKAIAKAATACAGSFLFGLGFALAPPVATSSRKAEANSRDVTVKEPSMTRRDLLLLVMLLSVLILLATLVFALMGFGP